ncbi:MAG TPA: lysine transporter LysE [Firmicutes bacterium]|jgi:threonine/homoserine/homoserine lactone efflux protein|nr:lysine transporter LysE [Bacillota bacterium]
MIFQGFKFGMLLQFAVGPVCIFIFQTASSRGFYPAAAGIFGVALGDGIYILAAIVGIASFIERKNAKIFFKIFGAVVLFIFGTSTILSGLDINFLPGLGLPNISHSNHEFFPAMVLTASNPLTIIFWAGVFSTKITAGNMKPRDIYAFGFGALLSTVFFLTLIALAGSLTKTFFPASVIQIFNGMVGLVLIYFSIKMITKKG